MASNESPPWVRSPPGSLLAIGSRGSATRGCFCRVGSRCSGCGAVVVVVEAVDGDEDVPEDGQEIASEVGAVKHVVEVPLLEVG